MASPLSQLQQHRPCVHSISATNTNQTQGARRGKQTGTAALAGSATCEREAAAGEASTPAAVRWCRPAEAAAAGRAPAPAAALAAEESTCGLVSRVQTRQTIHSPAARLPAMQGLRPELRPLPRPQKQQQQVRAQAQAALQPAPAAAAERPVAPASAAAFEESRS